MEISDGEVDGESQDEIQERPSSDENTADNYVEPKRGGSRARRSKMPEIGAAPPVDLLSISTPPTSPPHQSRSHFSVRSLPSDQVQVQVPPVTNRWTYKTHRLERAVDRVLKEFKEDGDIVFLIRYEDGHQEKVSC